jgi:dihydrofolate reductase
MRTVTFGVATSLDHYIARPDHRVDFLDWSPEAASATSRYWKTIDTVLMGRKTYERGAREGYPGVKNYVFSKTLRSSPNDRVELVKGDAVQFVSKLKGSVGKGICVMGGGELARSLLEAGLIDQIVLNIHPVLLGSGIRLFHPMATEVKLELVAIERAKNGCVLATYRVARK